MANIFENMDEEQVAILRAALATAAMHAIRTRGTAEGPAVIARASVIQADALIEELKK